MPPSRPASTPSFDLFEEMRTAVYTARVRERRADAAHPPTVQGVTLASLHTAKGLEWDAVFLVGLSDGTLPTTYSTSHRKCPAQFVQNGRPCRHETARLTSPVLITK